MMIRFIVIFTALGRYAYLNGGWLPPVNCVSAYASVASYEY